MAVSRITQIADEKPCYQLPLTSYWLEKYPYLVEHDATYTDDLWHWVNDNLTKDFHSRGASDGQGQRWCQFFFKDADAALLFKLTWLGKHDTWAWEYG